MRELFKYIPLGPIAIALLIFILMPFDKSVALSTVAAEEISRAGFSAKMSL